MDEKTPPPPPRLPGGGWHDRDGDTGPDDRGHPPEQESPFTAGLSVINSVQWIGLVGGPVLIIWGWIWVSLGRPLGWVLLLLGAGSLVWTIWLMVHKLRARRRR